MFYDRLKRLSRVACAPDGWFYKAVGTGSERAARTSMYTACIYLAIATTFGWNISVRVLLFEPNPTVS